MFDVAGLKLNTSNLKPQTIIYIFLFTCPLKLRVGANSPSL